MGGKILEGKTIFLRPHSTPDVQVWLAWFNDHEVTEHMNRGAFPVAEHAQLEFFQDLSRSRTDTQLGIVLKEDSLLIGTVGIYDIHWIHRHCAIKIVLGAKQCRAQGLATEAVGLIVRHAFTKLNLHRLTAGMWGSNMGSRACFGKNGFILEGTLRESFFYRDTYVDECNLGLLRCEWEAAQQAA